MINTNEDFYIKIKKEINRWNYLIEDKNTAEGIKRLANSTLAKLAWLELSKKEIIQRTDGFDQSIFSVASRIGRYSISAYLEDSQKLTSQEIKRVTAKAVKLASDLKSLILENSLLRFYGAELIPEVERAAFSKILGGVISLACEVDRNDVNNEGRIFSEKIEKEVNESFVTNHPKHTEMTSVDAYKVLRWRNIFDDSFIESLDLFVGLVKQVSYEPILPRPKKELADENVYSIQICDLINNAYGSPCFEISANLCTAFFDHEIDPDTIKKWWHRRGDTSKDYGN